MGLLGKLWKAVIVAGAFNFLAPSVSVLSEELPAGTNASSRSIDCAYILQRAWLLNSRVNAGVSATVIQFTVHLAGANEKYAEYLFTHPTATNEGGVPLTIVNRSGLAVFKYHLEKGQQPQRAGLLICQSVLDPSCFSQIEIDYQSYLNGKTFSGTFQAPRKVPAHLKASVQRIADQMENSYERLEVPLESGFTYLPHEPRAEFMSRSLFINAGKPLPDNVKIENIRPVHEEEFLDLGWNDVPEMREALKSFRSILGAGAAIQIWMAEGSIYENAGDYSPILRHDLFWIEINTLSEVTMQIQIRAQKKF